MQNVMQLHCVGKQKEHNMGAWLRSSPRAAFWLMLVGAPVCMVGAVSVCAGAVMIPVALVMGWM